VVVLPDSLACPTAGECLLVVFEGKTVALDRTDDGGRQWSEAPSGIDDLSCPSTSTCLAMAGGLLVTSDDGGRTWSRGLPLPASTQATFACPTARTCVAAGGTEVAGAALAMTHDAGASWATARLPADMGPGYLTGESTTQGAGWILAVTCQSATRCIAVGTTRVLGRAGGAPVALVTTDGGTSWTQHAMPAGADDVSCTKELECVAVGSAGSRGVAMVTTDGGVSWREVPLPADAGAAVSCVGRICVAVGAGYGGSGEGRAGAVIVASDDRGATWSTVRIALPAGALGAVSCASATFCVAAGARAAGAGHSFDFPLLLVTGT
jgi:hypothetical protein